VRYNAPEFQAAPIQAATKRGLIHFTFWMAFGDRVMLASPLRGIWFDVGFYRPDGCSQLGVALAAVLHGYR